MFFCILYILISARIFWHPICKTSYIEAFCTKSWVFTTSKKLPTRDILQLSLIKWMVIISKFKMVFLRNGPAFLISSRTALNLLCLVLFDEGRSHFFHFLSWIVFSWWPAAGFTSYLITSTGGCLLFFTLLCFVRGIKIK